jgi:hypothetical protein
MRDGIKLWFFRHHWWITSVVGVLLITLVLCVPVPEKGAVVVALVASLLSLIFFVQQQKLAEMSLFRQLATDFNARYDKINGTLENIARAGRLQSLEDGQTAVDYFNLCAEEYLFYSEGFIHPRVWRAWCMGMLQYLEREPFRSMWTTESATDSYYGLTIAEIKTGARR